MISDPKNPSITEFYKSQSKCSNYTPLEVFLTDFKSEGLFFYEYSLNIRIQEPEKPLQTESNKNQN